MLIRDTSLSVRLNSQLIKYFHCMTFWKLYWIFYWEYYSFDIIVNINFHSGLKDLSKISKKWRFQKYCSCDKAC